MRTSKPLRRLESVATGITVSLLLVFTGAASAVADTPPDAPRDDEHDPPWVDDPYAPHDTRGTNLRLGSAVGHLVHGGKTYTALGAAVAAGPRYGRFTFELDYLFLGLSAPGPSNLSYGRAHRVGAMARADLVRLGSRWLGANSMLALYGELGVARQWHQWSRPNADEPVRMVPLDSSANLAVVGFGLNLDHRLEKPLGFPSRIGWQLGWQLTSTPEASTESMIVCRGPQQCAAASSVPMTTAEARNTALLVTSTIAFTW